jgi:hypothetical protein
MEALWAEPWDVGQEGTSRE